MLRIRKGLDPFHFGQPDPDPDLGIKTSAKITENFHKNQPKYHTFFTDINIYPIDKNRSYFGEIYFFIEKKVKVKLIFSRF